MKKFAIGNPTYNELECYVKTVFTYTNLMTINISTLLLSDSARLSYWLIAHYEKNYAFTEHKSA